MQSNMNGCITHYASGQSAIFCGSKYATIGDVFKIGFIFAFVGWFCFGVVGMAWWKMLGYF
jgi:divalent anion:Na+ symporter, DASS family